MSKVFRPGDWVIYRKTKHSSRPGPRAQNVAPSPNGDEYAYTVDKFWIVTEVHGDGSIVLQTRKGKKHVLSADVPNLYVPNFLQRWWYAQRFENVAKAVPGGEKSVERAS